jgi:Zn-dependent M28 family amino/carboxypeptidase
MRRIRPVFITLLGLAFIAVSAWLIWILIPHPTGKFDGQRAYHDVQTQTGFGPRTPGSPAHERAVEWIQKELKKAGWQANVQEAEMNGQAIQNIIARRSNEPPQVILGAHYDSRLLADRDQESGNHQPVPGANDGASGVAVLLELARTIPTDSVPLWLVFFDAEDNGNLPGWEWIMGSRAFVAALETRPSAVVIVDMIGDAGLNIYIERNSDTRLAKEIWGQAAGLGYKEQFIAKPKYSLIDDHIPFLEVGIPAVDIIDFDYPYWHTTEDTPDKVSAESLQAVGETLWYWIAGLK